MNQSTNILGVEVSAITYDDVLRRVTNWVIHNQHQYISIAAVHLIIECVYNPKLREAVNRSGFVTPDGMPLVWLSHLYGQFKVQRVYGPTLMLKLCEEAEKKGYSIFLLGGAKGQSLNLKEKLLLKFPKLTITGHIDTPAKIIPQQRNSTIIKSINRSKAKIIFVGIGCPLQESWMAKHRLHINANALVGVGAAFDFLTGKFNQAPAWLQNAGLEWFYRLVQEPRRLFMRYTYINLLFTWLILKQLTHDFVLRRIKIAVT